MSLPQTDFELKFISKNLIPEKYQEGFNSIIEKYTENLYKDFSTFLESTARSIINTKDPSLIKSRTL
ncbi:hypothetical protein [Clostridium sp. FP1]|uniref:hypothetical protein n=1 Tax=Clostridium sp. FP1 TaxID=2724076 RepID=UPI001CCDE2BC|nr:hypothetical protein [Clostridium sp. FP1]MBZ9633741.1 hypothetical protein [Clostridium sp. FP1]